MGECFLTRRGGAASVDTQAYYDSGYSAGQSDGYSSGHSAGYSSGHSAGYSSGYSAGYDAGYAEGEEAGSGSGGSGGSSGGTSYSGLIPDQYITEIALAKTQYTGDYAGILVLDNDKDINAVCFLMSDFIIQSYDPATTKFTMKGAVYCKFNTATNDFTLYDYRTEASTGAHYIKNIKGGTQFVTYSGVTLWPCPIDTFVDVVSIQYANLASGTFSETLETGTTVSYTVTTDSSGSVTAISDGTDTTAVDWGT